MKKIMYGHLLSVALVGSLLLSGCQKEKTGFLRLNAERLTSNEKTYVDGTAVQWLVGDQVRVNGIEYELVNDNTVSGNPIEGDLLVIYPSSISDAAAPSNNQVTVTIPSEYTYETVDIGGGSMKQKLAMPMVGVAAGSATSMTIRHLCSAMQITVTNGFTDWDEELVLDSIILRGTGLSGTTAVSNLSNSGIPTVGVGNVDSVRISFSNCTIAVNGNMTVQIPVLPVTSGTTWVSVRGHVTSGTAYRYSRSTSIALGRAKVYAAPVTMTTPVEGNHMEEIEVSSIPEGALPGGFTVDEDGHQVYFSKGNLRATTSDLGAHWTWSFAEHQYDHVGTATANTSINGNGTVSVNGTVDLFGWSTSATYYGIHNKNSISYYNGDFVDWGTAYNNANSTSGWRTLTGGLGGEWDYLLNGRGTDNNWACYAKVKINVNSGVEGLIIFPDGVNKSGNTATLAGVTFNNANQSESDFSKTIEESEWSALEAAGCVFLPEAGYRLGKIVYNVGVDGNYWSSTSTSGDGRYSVVFDDNLYFLDAGHSSSRKSGFSVRLVLDKITH